MIDFSQSQVGKMVGLGFILFLLVGTSYSSCPHEQDGLVPWSASSSWESTQVFNEILVNTFMKVESKRLDK